MRASAASLRDFEERPNRPTASVFFDEGRGRDRSRS